MKYNSIFIIIIVLNNSVSFVSGRKKKKLIFAKPNTNIRTERNETLWKYMKKKK